jgi:hypothetical protein
MPRRKPVQKTDRGMFFLLDDSRVEEAKGGSCLIGTCHLLFSTFFFRFNRHEEQNKISSFVAIDTVSPVSHHVFVDRQPIDGQPLFRQDHQ